MSRIRELIGVISAPPPNIGLVGLRCGQRVFISAFSKALVGVRTWEAASAAKWCTLQMKNMFTCWITLCIRIFRVCGKDANVLAKRKDEGTNKIDGMGTVATWAEYTCDETSLTIRSFSQPAVRPRCSWLRGQKSLLAVLICGNWILSIQEHGSSREYHDCDRCIWVRSRNWRTYRCYTSNKPHRSDDWEKEMVALNI